MESRAAAPRAPPPPPWSLARPSTCPLSGAAAIVVIIWEVCAFAALATVLVAGVTWCLSIAAAGRAAGSMAFPTAAPAGRASGVCGLAEIDISPLPKSPYQHRLGHRRAPRVRGQPATPHRGVHVVEELAPWVAFPCYYEEFTSSSMRRGR
ncbi:unnamed protein product [Miscanthus lutarioriparius]|uniref:Uncharacterized protein n=1 Tax=Miscanthus lutarioriparius TaxID=422564 RepID=A0A811PNJ2_9POAL|nr:unnamed protein product [Miscanthus lutarioriparius]